MMKPIFLLIVIATLWLTGCSSSATNSTNANARNSANTVSPSNAANNTAANSANTSNTSTTASSQASLDKLLPEKIQVGGATWTRIGPIETDAQIPCPGTGKGARYGTGGMKDGEYAKRVFLNLNDCGTAKDADAALAKLSEKMETKLTPRKKGKLLLGPNGLSSVWSSESMILGLVVNGDAKAPDLKAFMETLP